MADSTSDGSETPAEQEKQQDISDKDMDVTATKEGSYDKPRKAKVIKKFDKKTEDLTRDELIAKVSTKITLLYISIQSVYV